MRKQLVEYCKKWFNSHEEYPIEQKVIWIYDLYQNYRIEEDEEEELYEHVDPNNEINEFSPCELWWNDNTTNKLLKAMDADGIK